MTVYVNVMARKPDGGVSTAELEGVCYACIGKYSGNIENVVYRIGDATPVTLSHENMANNPPSKVTEEFKKCFAKMWDVFPCFRTCLTTPDNILAHERALFDVANYSFNEVMHCMFLMRQMVNDHCSDYMSNEMDLFPADVMAAFTSRGKPWWMGYLAMIAPSLDREACNAEQFGGWDASVYRFEDMSVEGMVSILEGTFEYKYCDKSYKKVLDEEQGYTRNILQLSSSQGSPTMEDVYDGLNEILTGNTGGEDLFGNSINSGSAVSSVDELVEKTAEYFSEVFGDVKCL